MSNRHSCLIGPWKIEPQESNFRIEITDEATMRVALITGDHRNHRAELIVQAPNLLETLLQLQDWFSSLLDQNRGEFVTLKRRAIETVQIEVTEAIEKARLESPGPGAGGNS